MSLVASSQVRAMQIIDELEVNKRGPYGGGMGYVAYNGNMDIALALRTMVIPNPPPSAGSSGSGGNGSDMQARKEWTVHLQVGLLPCALTIVLASWVPCNMHQLCIDHTLPAAASYSNGKLCH